MKADTSQKCKCCWTTVLGIAFFVLAAACYFYTSIRTYQGNSAMRQMLASRNITPDMIRDQVGVITGSRVATDWSFPAVLGFMMLGFACLLPARRHNHAVEPTRALSGASGSP